MCLLVSLVFVLVSGDLEPTWEKTGKISIRSLCLDVHGQKVSHLHNLGNLAQWRYTNQWPYREVVLLLVENWIPIPRLGVVKYLLPSQFLMVSRKPLIDNVVCMAKHRWRWLLFSKFHGSLEQFHARKRHQHVQMSCQNNQPAKMRNSSWFSFSFSQPLFWDSRVLLDGTMRGTTKMP